MRRNHCNRSPNGTYSITRNLCSCSVQHPTRDTIFWCAPNNFIIAISNRNSSFCTSLGSSNKQWVTGERVLWEVATVIVKLRKFTGFTILANKKRHRVLKFIYLIKAFLFCRTLVFVVTAAFFVHYALLFHLKICQHYLTGGKRIQKVQSVLIWVNHW